MAKSYRHQVVMLQLELNFKHIALASTTHTHKTEGDRDENVFLGCLIQLTECCHISLYSLALKMMLVEQK